MKESLIFDLDGTLWDTTRQVGIVWNEILKKYGIKINKEQLKCIMGLTKDEIVNKLFQNKINDGYKFINECQKEENEYLLLNGGDIYKNTVKTIIKLYSKFDLYIVSNCQTGYIEAFLRYYNLEKNFQDFECSGNTNLSKDKNLEIIMKRNGIKKCIYVGDTQKEYEAARNTNSKFIWAKYGFGICNKYDYYINDISELLKLDLIKNKKRNQ